MPVIFPLTTLMVTGTSRIGDILVFLGDTVVFLGGMVVFPPHKTIWPRAISGTVGPCADGRSLGCPGPSFGTSPPTGLFPTNEGVWDIAELVVDQRSLEKHIRICR